MPRAQEPAEDECECVVNDDPLNLLGEALVTHLATPASCLQLRWNQHDPGEDLEAPGDTPSRLSTGRRPFQLASLNASMQPFADF